MTEKEFIKLANKILYVKQSARTPFGGKKSELKGLKKLYKAINYTRCCETLKDKEVPTFEEWKKINKIKESKCGKKLADNEGYVFEEWELIDKYNHELMNL